MQSFAAYLESLGGLHDSRISKFTLDVAQSQATFDVHDLYDNFAGLPEYPGLTPARIVLKEAKLLRFILDPAESLWIYEFSVEPGADQESIATIRFTPGGRMEFSFQSAIITAGDRVLWPFPPGR